MLPSCGFDLFISIKEILNVGNDFYLRVFPPHRSLLADKGSEERAESIKAKRSSSEEQCLTNLDWVTGPLLSRS